MQQKVEIYFKNNNRSKIKLKLSKKNTICI